MEEAESEMIKQGAGKTSFVAIAVILILVVGGFLYLTQNADDSKKMMGESPLVATPVASVQSMETNPVPTVATSAMSESGSVKEFTLEGGAYYFKPAVLTVKKGDRVKITLTSADMPHNLVIDEFNAASEMVTKGNSTTVEFTADKAGSFKYYCSVGNHRAKGMEGTLTVTE